MYKELVFELEGGRPEGAHVAFFFERRMVARMRVIHATPESSWESVHASGRPEDVAELHARLKLPPQTPMQAVEVVSVTPRSIRYIVKWCRDSGTVGVPLDHLLHDTVGPDAMYGMTVRSGRIQVKAAAADGEKLLQYFTRVREAVGDRLRVRLVRVGDITDAGSLDAGRAPVDLRTEDRDLVELALASGYYDSPKRCGVRELGDAFGCSKSVVARKLRTIERRALESVLAASPARALEPEGLDAADAVHGDAGVTPPRVDVLASQDPPHVPTP